MKLQYNSFIRKPFNYCTISELHFLLITQENEIFRITESDFLTLLDNVCFFPDGAKMFDPNTGEIHYRCDGKWESYRIDQF